MESNADMILDRLWLLSADYVTLDGTPASASKSPHNHLTITSQTSTITLQSHPTSGPKWSKWEVARWSMKHIEFNSNDGNSLKFIEIQWLKASDWISIFSTSLWVYLSYHLAYDQLITDSVMHQLDRGIWMASGLHWVAWWIRANQQRETLNRTGQSNSHSK